MSSGSESIPGGMLKEALLIGPAAFGAQPSFGATVCLADFFSSTFPEIWLGWSDLPTTLLSRLATIKENLCIWLACGVSFKASNLDTDQSKSALGLQQEIIYLFICGRVGTWPVSIESDYWILGLLCGLHFLMWLASTRQNTSFPLSEIHSSTS